MASAAEDTYTPLVSLKEIKVDSGEEQEVCVYKQRSKLYRFDNETKEWKERGTGNSKFLQHKEKKIVRFLLRQEKTLKVVANHVIDPQVELKSSMGSDTTWVWAASDYAEGELKNETFALRFKTPEIASEFKAKFSQMQENNKKVLDGEEVKVGESVETADEEGVLETAWSKFIKANPAPMTKEDMTDLWSKFDKESEGNLNVSSISDLFGELVDISLEKAGASDETKEEVKKEVSAIVDTVKSELKAVINGDVFTQTEFLSLPLTKGTVEE